MAATRLWLLGLVLGVALALHPEDDFAFEEQQELLSPISHPHPTSAPVQRLWGVPDSVTSVGKLFRLTIPTDAFSGNLDHYEARGQGGGPLPSWLLFDKATGVFEGVPGVRDVGEHYITVRALGQHPQDSAKDVFSIEVRENAGPEMALVSGVSSLVKEVNKVKCEAGEDPTILTILLDVKYEHLKPKQRVLAIKNLSGFLALHQNMFTFKPHNSQDDLLSDTVVLAGPGNIKKKSTRQSSAIRWQVGCEGRLTKQHALLAHQLRQQARDGTLSEVLQQPVVGWHVKTEAIAGHRERRETGSGDFVDDDDPTYDYSDVEDEDSESIPETRIVPTMSSPVFPEATVSHAHRHHHGEVVEQLAAGSDVNSLLQPSITYKMPSSPVLYNTILPTPVLIPVRPTHLMSSEMVVEPSRVYQQYAEVTPSATPVFITEVESSITTDMPTSQVTEPLPTSSSSSSSSGSSSSSSGATTGTTGASSSSSSSSSTTELTSTTEEDTTSSTPLVITERSSSPRPTDEVVEYDYKNIRPTIEQRLPKLPITAGKAFRYQIPEDAFSDLEDGNTRNLRLIFKMQDGTSVPSSSWVQFDPEKQEVYALPLEEQVSKWEYVLEAMDKEGKSVSDNLAIQVQHHKGRRTVNYEFSILLRVEKMDFPSDVDWQLQIIDSLSELYGDSDANFITVRAINMTTDPIIFTWTNDSLPRIHCPRESIDKLFKVLIKNDNGEPSTALKKVLSAFKIDVKKVTRRDLGPCIKASTSLPSPINPTENFRPVVRNQVDHINATVGELLSFRVPEDSFYDPEDGSARNLKLTLLTIDRSPIPPTNWLQFETKNQEFYGIPLPGDEGRKEYQLVCEDKGGQTANDGLVVVVHPAAKVHYNVEFSMTLGIPYEQFKSSAALKRKFIDKLCELFDTKNTSAIVLRDIKEGSTIVTWANRTLPTDTCPESEIGTLRRMLANDDGQVSAKVNLIMVEFDVQKVEMTPMGVCQGGLTRLHTPEPATPPSQGTQPVQQSDDYLVTYVVPAVIIVAMLLLAGIVACILYRRRRTGKMSVGDEDERQTFRNKGIPVIFQDELEEKPDPGNKSPVIMKEEKPPLPPPEYQRGELEQSTPPPTAAHPLLGDSNTSEDPPYQPPPPFTTSRDSGRQNRPKPTPTYRKPPPYVPP